MCKVRLPSQHCGDRGWRIAHKLELSLGYVARLCLKNKHNKPKQQESLKQRARAEQRCGHAGGPAPANRFLLPTSPRRYPAALLGSQCPFHAELPPLWYSVRFSDTPVPPAFAHAVAYYRHYACPSTVPFLRFTSCLVCKTRNQYSAQKVFVRMNWIRRRIADRGSGPQCPNLYMEGDSSLRRKVGTVW